MIHVERQVIRLVCERCQTLSPLHFHGADHARKQMMAIGLREGPWRCLPPDLGKPELIEDVCGDCVRKEEREQTLAREKALKDAMPATALVKAAKEAVKEAAKSAYRKV